MKRKRDYCVDPYGSHKTKRCATVQGASRALAAKVNDRRIKTGTPLCLSCRKSLVKAPDSLPPEESEKSSDSPDSRDDMEAPFENESSGSHDSHDSHDIMDDVEQKSASATVTEVLASLGQSPIITSEYLVRSIADNDQPCIIQFMEANLSYQSATEHKWGFLCHLIPFGRSRPLKGCAI